MDALAAARAWVDGWTAGWRAHDPEPIAALYADDALFLSQPFREPLRGPEGARAYAERVFAEEESAEFWFGEPIASGDRAAVEYWATIVSEGRPVTLGGATLLRFGPDGRVVEHRDYWALEDGERDRTT